MTTYKYKTMSLKNTHLKIEFNMRFLNTDFSDQHLYINAMKILQWFPRQGWIFVIGPHIGIHLKYLMGLEPRRMIQ